MRHLLDIKLRNDAKMTLIREASRQLINPERRPSLPIVILIRCLPVEFLKF
jgi:hypothetical protein